LALTERVALSDRIGDGPSTRLRLTADIAEARILSYEDPTLLLPELQSLLSSTDLDNMRRLRAAKALMIAADSLLDEALARTVYETMPRQPASNAESLLKDQVELIFHSVFGDRKIALRLAEALSLRAEKVELSPASVSAQLTASLALRIVDGKVLDTSRLERLFDRCLASSMYEAAIRTASRIGSIQFDCGALDLARYWCERTTELVTRSGVGRLSADYQTLQIDLALEDNDIASAQRLIDNAPVRCPIYGSPRFSNEYLVYRVRIAQRRCASASSEEYLESLMEWHARAKHLGRHDDSMEVLWTALWRAGKRDEASGLLREYLSNARRERRAFSPVLRRRMNEDPIWRELPRPNPPNDPHNSRTPLHAISSDEFTRPARPEKLSPE
jgi:hypothetical protein